MYQRPALAKIAAVVSSLVLAGGYVAYQGGVRLLPGSKSARTLQVDWVADDESSIAEPTTQPVSLSESFPLLAGSKSMAPLVSPGSTYPYGGRPALASTTQPARMLLPGSKSNVHLTEPNIIYGDGHIEFVPVFADPNASEPRTLLPGSKTFIMTGGPNPTPGPTGYLTTQPSRRLMPGSKGGILMPTTERTLLPGPKTAPIGK